MKCNIIMQKANVFYRTETFGKNMVVKLGCYGKVDVNVHVTVTLKYSHIFFLGKVAMFGSHSLNGFEIVYLFREWGSKHPLTPPPHPSLIARTTYEGVRKRSAELAYRLRVRLGRF